MFDSAKILVFDFDGVIADSQKECLFLSYQTFSGLSLADFSTELIPESFVKKFMKYRYLVGPPEEYLSLCESIVSDTVPESFTMSSSSNKEIDLNLAFSIIGNY